MTAAITKAELSRLLGVTRARITQLAGRGLPLLADGRVDREAALRWIAVNCSSYGGGWLLRNSGSSISERARKLLNSGQPEKLRRAPRVGPRSVTTTVASVRRELLDRLLRNRSAIAELTLTMGVKDVGVAIGLYECFASLVITLAEELADSAYDWAGSDDIPDPDIDWRALAEKHGLRYGPEDEARADKILDDLYRLLDEPVQATTAKTPEREVRA